MIRFFTLSLTLLSFQPGGWAQIIYSGILDIEIPKSFDGLYVDIDGMATGNTEATVPGWDVNLFLGGAGVFTNSTFRAVSAPAGGDLAANLNMGISDSVGSGLGLDFSTDNTITGSAFHLGNGVGQFLSGTEGYLGFELDTAGGARYGWMRVTFTNDMSAEGPAGTLHDYAYDSTGATMDVGVVPEPATYAALLGLFSLLVVYVRRRFQTA